MTSEQRKKASVDLTLTFFQSYSSRWRLTKVLAIQKLINQRYPFYTDILNEIRDYDDENIEAAIAQEVHNGLHHDAIAQCIQYIEDFFALLNATKSPDFFIQKITTYKAGNILNTIERYKASREQIVKDFCIPIEVGQFENGQPELLRALDILVELVRDQITFYKQYEFFYNQYKHGLSIPLRGHGNTYTEEQINLDKAGEFEPMVAVYDNKNLTAAKSKGTFYPLHGVMMPGFTENVRPIISKLMKEDNFLRLVYSPHSPEFNFELLVDQAFKTRACMNILIGNYQQKISPEADKTFRLPVDHRSDKSYVCTYSDLPRN